MNNKKFIEDIKPPKKRSIRDIPLLHKTKSEDITFSERIEREKSPRHTQIEAEVSSYETYEEVAAKRSWLHFGTTGLIVVFVIVVAGAVFFTSNMYSSAAITLKQKKVDVSVNENIVSKNDSEVISHKVVTMKKEATQVVPANADADVSIKANGTIAIFNKNSVAQPLITGTRFRSTSGKIYKIQKAVTVPAAKTVSGKVTAGSVDAVVYADVAGPEYNSPLTDFTLPGFDGTPKAKLIYARSRTEITGGAVGKVKKASDTDMAITESSLRNSLKETLLSSVRTSLPQGFVLPENYYSINYSSSTVESKSDSVVMKVSAEIKAVVFNKKVLAKYLAGKYIKNYSNEDITIPDNSGLNYGTSSLNFSKDLEKEFNFNLTGTTTIMYVYDRDKLLSDIVGKDKVAFKSLIMQYPGIEMAKAVISPVWVGSFPTNKDKITIEEE